MMLLETLNKRTTDRHDAGLATVNRLAEAEATGRAKASDAAALDKALIDAGMTPEQFTELVELHTKRAALKTRVADGDHWGAEASRLRKQMRALEADRDAYLTEVTGKLDVLHRDIQNAVVRLDSAQRGADDLTSIEFEHRALFGLPDVDFDAHTLTCGTEIVTDCDPKAPELRVPLDVFLQEKRRRRQIIRRADEEARTRYAARKLSWLERVGLRKPLPRYEQPTWLQALAGGYDKLVDAEFDRAETAAGVTPAIEPDEVQTVVIG